MDIIKAETWRIKVLVQNLTESNKPSIPKPVFLKVRYTTLFNISWAI